MSGEAFSEVAMGIRSWFSDVFGFDLFDQDWSPGDQEPSFNPANGLPMVGAVDIEGNPFGMNFHSFDHTSSMFEGSFGMGSSADSFSSMGSGMFSD